MATFPTRSISELETILEMTSKINPIISKYLEFEARTGLRYCDASRLSFNDLMINGTIRDSFTVIQSKGYKARIKKGVDHKVAEANSKILIEVSDELKETIRTLMVINGSNELLFQSSHHHAKKGTAISIQAINQVLKKVAVELALPYQLSTHTFRKSFAKMLLDDGAKMIHVRDALGHSDISTTQIYCSTFDNEAGEYARNVSFRSA